MKSLSSQRGFSLIEVLVALSVIAGALLVVSMAWSTSHLRMKKMKMNYQVASLLDLKVAELERKYKNEITLLPEEDEGDFNDLSPEYKDYTWKMVSKKFELPDLTPILAQQQDNANPMLAMVIEQMTDFFNQSVKELTVTVVYKQKKNIVHFSMGGGGLPGTGDPSGGTGGAAGGGDDGSGTN
jgi:general secretion pathway protein I